MSRRVATNFAAQSVQDEGLIHLRQWLLRRINPTSLREVPAGCSSLQRGCPDLIPGLRSKPFWDATDFPWVRDLEAQASSIRGELLQLRRSEKSGFQPYRSPAGPKNPRAGDGVGGLGTDTGEWNVFYIFLHGMDFAENQERAPVTAAAIEAIPGQYHHAFFSSTAPGTHITKHHGPTNKKLRLQLPLICEEGVNQLRVGDEIAVLEEGKAIIFDDSFEHEAWNKGSKSRLILILDLWHPDLLPKEKNFFAFLQKASMRAVQKASDAAKADWEAPEWHGENFFSVISEARRLAVDESAVWSGVQ